MAIGSMLLLLLVMGIVDLGLLFSDRLAISNAARGGARWASKHPTTWTAAASPDSNTIEGQVQAAGGVTSIPNDDAHISVKYYDLTSGSAVYCGMYSASANAFQPATGYTQNTCVVPGALAEVTVTYTYPLLTPLLTGLFGAGVTVAAGAAFLEEQ